MHWPVAMPLCEAFGSSFSVIHGFSLSFWSIWWQGDDGGVGTSMFWVAGV